MEHIAALLLIIGCSDDMLACRELPATVPVYETVEECESELQPSLSMFSHEYAQILGSCVMVDPALEEEDAELVWDITPNGSLYAAIASPDVVIASNIEGREKDYVTLE